MVNAWDKVNRWLKLSLKSCFGSLILDISLSHRKHNPSFRQGVLTFGVNERDFVQIQALFAPRCSVSRKKSNAERREMDKNTPFSLNVHTP
jgi:hypothetical protein